MIGANQPSQSKMENNKNTMMGSGLSSTEEYCGSILFGVLQTNGANAGHLIFDEN